MIVHDSDVDPFSVVEDRRGRKFRPLYDCCVGWYRTYSCVNGIIMSARYENNIFTWGKKKKIVKGGSVNVLHNRRGWISMTLSDAIAHAWTDYPKKKEKERIIKNGKGGKRLISLVDTRKNVVVWDGVVDREKHSFCCTLEDGTQIWSRGIILPSGVRIRGRRTESGCWWCCLPNGTFYNLTEETSRAMIQTYNQLRPSFGMRLVVLHRDGDEDNLRPNNLIVGTEEKKPFPCRVGKVLSYCLTNRKSITDYSLHSDLKLQTVLQYLSLACREYGMTRRMWKIMIPPDVREACEAILSAGLKNDSTGSNKSRLRSILPRLDEGEGYAYARLMKYLIESHPQKSTDFSCDLSDHT
jgi:hypothetical protein